MRDVPQGTERPAGSRGKSLKSRLLQSLASVPAPLYSHGFPAALVRTQRLRGEASATARQKWAGKPPFVRRGAVLRFVLQVTPPEQEQHNVQRQSDAQMLN